MPVGWLLDVTSTRDGDAVALWLKGADGRVHRVEVPYRPPFYVQGERGALEDLGRALEGRRDIGALGLEEVRTSLFDPLDVRHTVLAVTPVPHGARRSVATDVDRRGRCVAFTLFDVDLTAPQLFYLENDLYPFAPVRWSGTQVAALEPADAEEYAPPPLRVAELAVEVVGARPGRPTRPDDPVARVRLGDTVVEGADEGATLAALGEELARQDPDLLATRGGDLFDVPHLYRRALATGLGPEGFRLGRETVPFRLAREGSSFVSYGKIYHKAPAHHLNGRFHLDLEERFVDDVQLAGYIDVCRLSRLGLQTVSRQSPGTAFSAMEIAVALRDGVHIPWKKNLPERPKSATRLVAADRGGFILTPPVGLFEGVDEFDFASLFPSIMVGNNLSLETLDCPCCPESTRLAPGLGYRSCLLRDGLVPRTLRPILSRRLHYKREKRTATGAARERYDALAKAWKWVLVTSFGYQGYRNARFGRIECHEAINAYARDLLVGLTARAQAEGWSVLHGIVDSLWLVPPPGADPEAWAEGVSRATGHPLGYEGRYRWIVFLPDAEYGLGVSQRYYGAYESGEVKVRGLETRRSDTCPFVQETQDEVIRRLAEARNAREVREALPRMIAYGKARLELLARGSWPRRELLLAHRVSQGLEAYRVFSDSVAALRQLKAAGLERAPGESVRFMVRDHTSEDWRRRVVAEPLMTGEETYDVAAYRELLARSFQSLFLPLGWDREKILQAWGEAPPRGRTGPRYRSPRVLGQRLLVTAGEEGSPWAA